MPKQSKRGLRNKRNDCLMIDGSVLKYDFVKRRPRTWAEIFNCIKYGLYANSLNSIDTRVSVVMDLNDMVSADYNKASNTVTIIGRFVVTYKNLDNAAEIVKDHRVINSCFSFEYNFENLYDFMSRLQMWVGNKKIEGPIVPVNL
jgi:hypothetical protein